MKHLPTEVWFCETKKAEIQPQDLERHLSTCSHCFETYQAWQEVERALLSPPCTPPHRALPIAGSLTRLPAPGRPSKCSGNGVWD